MYGLKLIDFIFILILLCSFLILSCKLRILSWWDFLYNVFKKYNMLLKGKFIVYEFLIIVCYIVFCFRFVIIFNWKWGM